ncbi:MAG TPA: nitroreductase family protein [Anaerohalosphaeraceae bacterium]|nr:nitroreductase family protein [Anaerohalosphaeraceae bacterium]HOL88264.1 nitroreductase family protein [Anaerohalosphaeraceae bacterium]HPP56674.1 nitroreductase family protein [Anaerohalosphaeraceae bacterium]
MDVMKAIENRYSCRAYLSKPVEKEKLMRILEAARLAPSARNLQDWRFVVVTEEQKRRELAQAAYNQAFVAQAPVVIAACSISSYMMRCGQPIAPIDVSIALEHIALEAVELGLATCWIGSFLPHEVRRILQIPTDAVLVELMTLGYPADEWKSPQRLSLEKIVCFEKWGF